MSEFDLERIHEHNEKHLREIAVDITADDPEDDPADDELVPPEYRGTHKDEGWKDEGGDKK